MKLSRLPKSAAFCPRGRRAAVVVLLAFGLVSARAQLRPVAIEGATVFTGSGPARANTNITLQGGKITSVGVEAAGMLTRRIPGRSKYVTPGFIDCYSTLGARLGTGPGTVTGRAADAFDRYATEELRILWQEGITAVCVPARAAPGFGGLNAVYRLHLDDAQALLKPEAALAAMLGVGWGEAQGPLVRVKLADELRRRFQQAREYREGWNDYQDAVKEYEEKLAERAKKSAETKPAAKPGEPKPADSKADKKDAPRDEKKEPAKDEKKDELKKPVEPGKDRGAETLLRVIDGDLRLWVEAHEPADILNALEMAEEQHLSLMITGATGAWLVADELARRHVPVVLTSAPEALRHAALESFEFGADGDYGRADAAAVLTRAGVEVYFGSGVLSGPELAPHLALRVARAVGGGLDEAVALEALTSRAARLLGISRAAGRIEPGMPADLVLWSDHPFAAGARVERVFVGGNEVWVAGGPGEVEE